LHYIVAINVDQRSARCLRDERYFVSVERYERNYTVGFWRYYARKEEIPPHLLVKYSLERVGYFSSTSYIDTSQHESRDSI
jgi:hypothetical protein